jgi:two-component system OmpR family response regulator
MASTVRAADDLAVRRRQAGASALSHLRITQNTDNAGVRVLIAEDDRKLAGLIARGLRESGMVVDVVHSGDRALAAGRDGYDALVLDVMLPGLDGFAVCRGLRAERVHSPILMLTARDAVEDRIRGLDDGADDYVPKPFSLDELAARLRALARRGPIERPTELVAGDLRMDPAARRVWRGDAELALSALELTLLETFLRHAGQVMDRTQLLAHAWPDPDAVGSNVVDVYVRYLREKIDRPYGLASLETVRGLGYRLRSDGGRAAQEP